MTPVLRWSNGSRLSRHEREREKSKRSIKSHGPPSRRHLVGRCLLYPHFLVTGTFLLFSFFIGKRRKKNLLRLDHHFIHPLWLFFALSHSFSTFGHSFRRCPSIFFFFSPKTKMQAEMRPKGGKFSLSFWLHLHRRKILRLNSRAARSVIIFNRERRTFSFFAGCLWGFAPMVNWR